MREVIGINSDSEPIFPFEAADLTSQDLSFDTKTMLKSRVTLPLITVASVVLLHMVRIDHCKTAVVAQNPRNAF